MASPSSRSFFLPSVIRVLLFFLLARLGLASSLPRCLPCSSSSSSCLPICSCSSVPSRCLARRLRPLPLLHRALPHGPSAGFDAPFLEHWLCPRDSLGGMRRLKYAHYPSSSPSLFSVPFLLFPSPSLLLLSLRFSFSRAGCGALNTHHCSFLFPPGGCDALNTVSLFLSLFLSFFLYLSLSLSLFLSFFLSFFLSSLSFLSFLFLSLSGLLLVLPVRPVRDGLFLFCLFTFAAPFVYKV